MMRVALCIAQEHDPVLVALAILICIAGSWASLELFGRVRHASGRNRIGWITLAAVGTGTMVWCTHFVAMMAFRAGVPVMLEPLLTLASLALAILIAAPGLAIAARGHGHDAAFGGALVGVATSTMHYLGMAAYRVDGIVTWDWRYVAASVILSSLLGALAFTAARPGDRRARTIAAGLLALSIVVLHFTGMAAMSVAVLQMNGEGLSVLTQQVLAITTAFAALLVLGCAAVSVMIDGSTQHEAYRRLRQMALYDALTGLPNRVSFQEEFGRRLNGQGGFPCMAVVMLDLSRFKAVNDTHGHNAGDQLLIALAARLRASTRESEFVARLGGDEFAALFSYREQAELDDFLHRLAAVFAQPFRFARFNAAVGANIGVALAPRDGRDADGLLAKADLAMYRAKAAHSAEPCLYDAAMDDALRERRDLGTDLREAVAAGAFELHYQVQATIGSGEIAGYEALVRWPHPSRGAIAPATFIPLAEELGLIIPLSVWVLRQACFEAALWPNRHPVAVNLSPMHLADGALIETVQAALHDSGLPPERLVLELTESALIHDRAFALEQLRRLKGIGVAIALDDFGVGYSSLDVLRSFGFDKIKLDASFVAGIEHDEQAVSILRSVAALGSSLHMPVLAEGIERPAQLVIVAREGCAAIQGYLIGKPSRTLANAAAVKTAMRLAPRDMERPFAAA